MILRDLLPIGLRSFAREQYFISNRVPRPHAPAYLCFTSGSTGLPIGVICSHEGLVAFQKDVEVRLFAVPGQKVAQLMSPAFDGSIHEIFSALSYGATLVLQTSADISAHLSRSTSAILTPSIAKVLNPSDFPSLKYVCSICFPETMTCELSG